VYCDKTTAAGTTVFSQKTSTVPQLSAEEVRRVDWEAQTGGVVGFGLCGVISW